MNLEKAYDVVPRKLLWPVIRKMGIPHEILVGVEKLHAKNEAHVKTGKRISGFKTTTGLKQRSGFIISLIQIYLESALHDWDKKYKSMELLRVNKTINYQLFADNWAIIAQDKDDAEYMTTN
jgi:hypothetical protein